MAEEAEDLFADIRQDPDPKKPQPKKEKAIDPTSGVVDPWKDVRENPGQFATRTSMGEARQTRKQDYIDYMPEGVYSDSNIDAKRAANQSFGEQAARTLGNLVPNIVTGLGESVGYLGALATEWGDDRDYSNWLTTSMQAAKNPFGEVYRENPNEVWSMGDSAWWLQNFSSLAESAASFALVGAGVGSMFGKGAAWIAQGLKAEGLGMAIAKGAATTATAATLAYTEGAMSGYQVYQRAYDKQFDRSIAAGMNPIEAEQSAKELASQAASTTVQLNTAINTVLNIPQLQMLFKNDDEIFGWVRGQGRQAAGLGDLAERLAKGMPREGWKHMAVEAGSEGLEEMVNQFAERTGDAVGDKTAKSGFVSQFSELSNFFDRTMDEEGALNFVLGAVGGVAQGVLLKNIPMHREIQRDEQGNALPVLGRDGEIVDGKYQTKLVSAKTRDENGTKKYYANVRDAVLKDIDWMQTKQQELADAVQAKDKTKAQSIRDEVLTNHLSNAIGMGMTEAFQQEYRNIASVDNTQDLSAPFVQQAQDLEQAKKDILEQEQANYADLSPDAKTSYDEADLAQKEAIKKADELKDQTAATQARYATDKNDNAYKEKAERQVKNLETFQKMYNDIKSRFLGVEGAEAANVSDAILTRRINNFLKSQNITDRETELSQIEAQNNQFLAQLGVDANTAMIEASLMDRQKAADAYNAMVKERKALETARTEYNEYRKKNKGNQPVGSKLEKMLGRYKINGFNPTNHNSMNTAFTKLNDRLGELQEKQRQNATSAEERIAATKSFTDWVATNSDKGIQDFMQDAASRREKRAAGFANRSDLRQARTAVEQAKAELEIAVDELRELESTKGVNNFIKAVLKDIDKTAAAEDAKIGAENKALEKIMKDREAGTKLENYQQNFLADQLTAKRALILTAITNQETEVARLTAAVQADKTAAGWKARIKNALLTTENESDLRRARTNLTIMKQQVAKLEQDIDELRSGVVNTPAPSPDPVPTTPEPTPDPVTPDPLTPDAVVPVDPEMVARKDFNDLMNTIPADERDWITDILTPVLNGTVVDNWDILDQDVKLGTLSAATAARLIQLAQQIAGTEEAAEVTSEIVPEVVVEDEVLNDPFENVAEVEHLVTPDQNDTAPDEDSQPSEITIDLPEIGTSEDIVVTNLPADGPQDIQLLEDSRFHSGRKTIDALSIANMTLDYEEGVDGLEYYIQTSSNTINQNTNAKVLSVGGLKVGDKLRLEVDTQYRGTVNKSATAGQKNESFDFYTDGKVGGTNNIIGNVPIRIVHEKSGEVIGYMRRTDWVTAKYNGATNYRNVADEISDGNGGTIKGNVAEQSKRLLAARRKVIEQFNANGGTITTSIVDRGPGTLMLNVEKDAKGKSQVVAKSATTALPDTNLEFGIASGGTIKVGKNSIFEETINTKNFSPYENSIFAMLPMPDGTYSLGRVDNVKLGDRKFDTATAAKALEVYLAQDEARAKQFEDLTGFDILSDDGIRNFIRQHYTHLNAFNSAVLAANAPVIEGQNRTMDFLFNITNRVGTATGEVAIGWSYSGKPKLVARLGPDGKLTQEFRSAFEAGLRNRYKNVTFTDTAAGIKGLNSTDSINEVVWDHNTDQLKVRKAHSNYNEYLKSFTSTSVNGTNKLPDGSYTYSANPQNVLDLNEIQRTLINTTAQAVPDAASIQDETDVQQVPVTREDQVAVGERVTLSDGRTATVTSKGPLVLTFDNGGKLTVQSLSFIEVFKTPTTEQPAADQLTDAEREILFGGEGGFMDMSKDFARPSKLVGIDEAYTENPALSNIGTADQYDKYVRSIFPNSAIKEIMYHDSYSKFDRKNFTGDKTMYFTSSRGAHFDDAPFTLRTLLNLQNPLVTDNKEITLKMRRDQVKSYEDRGYDGMIADSQSYRDDLTANGLDPNDPVYRQALLYPEVLVFDSSQLHVLGSEEDVEGFRRWVDGNVVDGGQPVNLQTLSSLLTFTPVNKRNGKTPEQVLYDLSQKGITQLAPGYNPFYQC